MIVRAMAEGRNLRDGDAIFARWKINDGPVLDIQFTKQNEKSCLLILLPPSVPSTVNVPSFFVFEPPSKEKAGGVAQLLASWQPHPSMTKDCMCYMDTHPPATSLRTTARESSAVTEQDESDHEAFGIMDDLLAADLAMHVTTAM
jgi:hypothetical protein